jgi:ribosomal protein L31E
MIDESIKNMVKKGLKRRFPIMLSGVIGIPHPKKSGHAIRLIKSCIVRKLQQKKYVLCTKFCFEAIAIASEETLV